MNKQEAEAKAIREYIGDDAQIVPYLYSNLSLYEKGHPYVKIWLDKNDDGEIEAVYLLYYNCLHIYSRGGLYHDSFLKRVMDENKVNVVMVPAEHSGAIECFAPTEWSSVTDFIIRHENQSVVEEYESMMISSETEIPEISGLLLSDAMYSELYTDTQLQNQLEDRLRDGYGKIFRERNEDEIKGCIAITGENDLFMFYGCLIVNHKYRHKGIAKKLINCANSYAFSKGKACLCFVGCENEPSLMLHRSLSGAKIVGKITKFIRKD